MLQLRKSRLLLGALLAAWGTTELAAGNLTGSFSPIATGSNVDLTLLGKTDWIHWGLYTASSLNRKAGVPVQISDYSLVTPVIVGRPPVVQAYQYADNYNGYTWYDGWPAAGITNTPTGVWAYQSYPLNGTGCGFEITAPADPTNRTLQVFVGAFEASGKLSATLSDGSGSYTDTSLTNLSNGPGGVYTLDYKANSLGQTLTVQWTLASRIGTNATDANVTLQAAALTVTNANNPPLATLTAPADQSVFPAPADITLSAEALDFDGTVTNVIFYAGTNQLGQSVGNPYTFTWSNVPAGHYYLSAAAFDNAGASRLSPPVEVFVSGSGGSLAGAIAIPPALVDLTAEGTNDWAHWGLTSTNSLDHRSGIPPQIAHFAVLGTAPVQQYTDNYTGFSWSNGTPTLECTNSTTGIFITGLTNGFTLTAPADPVSRKLRVYVGGYGTQASFEAWLSDASSAPFIDNSTSSEYGNAYTVYDLDYASASPGQQLTIVYRALKLFDYDYGNVTLQAATLVGGPSAPRPVSLANSQETSSGFTFSFATQSDHSYRVLYSHSLPATNWNVLTTVPGTGGSVTITNGAPLTNQCFYWIQTQ